MDDTLGLPTHEVGDWYDWLLRFQERQVLWTWRRLLEKTHPGGVYRPTWGTPHDN